jgi:hypothetical protein
MVEPITATLTVAALAAKTIKDVSDTATSVRTLLKGKGAAIDQEAVNALHLHIIELLDAVMDAKQAQQALIDENVALLKEKRALEERVAKQEEFDGERDAFEQRTLARHSYAMARKEEAGYPHEKTKYYCIPCFEQKHLSLLQFERADFYLDELKCPHCEASVFANNDIKAEFRSAPVGRRSLW